MAQEKEICRNARLFWWFAVFQDPLFWGPVVIYYIQHTGKMALSDIYLLESITVLGMTFLEIITGSLADQIGRKKTIMAGSFLCLMGAICFTVVNSPLLVWISNILWMTGLVLHSGADQALLFDSLKENDQSGFYQEILGKATAARFLLAAFSSLVVGWLSEMHPRLPIILSVPGILFSLIIVFCFQEPKYEKKKYSIREQTEIIKSSILFVSHHKKVCWIISFFIIISVSSMLWFFTYNPYFELVGLKMEYYGIIFFFLNIISWFFSRYSHAINCKIGEKTCIIMLVLLQAAPIFLLGTFITIPSLGLMLSQSVVRGFMSPFISRFINQHLDSESRATVISIKSAIYSFVSFLALNVFGRTLKIWTLPLCLQVLGIITLFFGVISTWAFGKIFGKVK